VRYAAAMEHTGIIIKSKRTSFVSYPFFVSKANGYPRLIVDYSHLRGIYDKSPLHLPPFCTALRRLRPILSLHIMARINLKDAFYSIPLPTALGRVTAVRVGSATYQFRALPMGLYVSPRILQAAVQAALLSIPVVFTWVLMDDIFLAVATPQLVHDALVSAVRAV
jgi:hypothetical protein